MESKIEKLQKTIDKLLTQTDDRDFLLKEISRLNSEKQLWLNTEWKDDCYIALRVPMPDWQKRNPYLRIPVYMRSAQYTDDKDGYEMNGLVEFCGKLLPEFYIYQWSAHSLIWQLCFYTKPIKEPSP